jgi:hypothetical protein
MRQTKITCILTTAAFSIISMISSGSLTVYADNYRPYDRSQDLIEFDGETAEEYKISGTGGASTNHYSDIPVSDF